MNICIMSSAPNGGAGIAAFRIFNSLRKKGVSVEFIDISVAGMFETIAYPNVSGTNNKISNTHFTIDKSISSREWMVQYLSKFDIINVHWVSNLISIRELLDLSLLGKKLVFTMHDFYFLTGGCHYPAGCSGYLRDCSSCLQADTKLINFLEVKKNKEIKKALFSMSTTFAIAPSHYLGEHIKLVNPNTRVYTIRNAYGSSIDSNVIYSNRENNIKKICDILLISDGFGERRKGFNLSMMVLENIDLTQFDKDIRIRVIGNLSIANKNRIRKISKIPPIFYGQVKNSEKIDFIYSQCDFILTTSYDDNWPNILVEALSNFCIPIVGPGHGCEEFCVTYGLSNVSKTYKVEDFVKALGDAISSKVELTYLKKIVDQVRSDHDISKVAEEYKKIFEISLNKKGEYDFQQDGYPVVKVDKFNNYFDFPFLERMNIFPNTVYIEYDGARVINKNNKGSVRNELASVQGEYGLVKFRIIN